MTNCYDRHEINLVPAGNTLQGIIRFLKHVKEGGFETMKSHINGASQTSSRVGEGASRARRAKISACERFWILVRMLGKVRHGQLGTISKQPCDLIKAVSLLWITVVVQG